MSGTAAQRRQDAAARSIGPGRLVVVLRPGFAVYRMAGRVLARHHGQDQTCHFDRVLPLIREHMAALGSRSPSRDAALAWMARLTVDPAGRVLPVDPRPASVRAGFPGETGERHGADCGRKD